MIHLAWRQFRVQAAIAAALLALVAVVVLVTGPNLGHLYRSTVAPCATHHDCAAATTSFLRSDHFLQGALPPLLLVAPALIGVFWGAPLVAREIESGTFRLVWTQSVSRLRWLVTRITLVGLAAMVVTGLLSLMVSWWFSPVDRINLNRFSPAMFGVRGITPIGYAAFGFALGVTMGVLVRRTVPAMALTIVGFLAARLAVTYWVRPNLTSPLRAVTPLTMPPNTPGGPVVAAGTVPPGSWLLSSQTLNRGGLVVGENGGLGQNGALDLRVTRGGGVSIPGAGTCPGAHLNAGIRTSPNAPDVLHVFDACARRLGLHEVLTYQPASRYWPFQWYETAVFFGLALLLVGVCLWWLVGREAHRSGSTHRVAPGTPSAPLISVADMRRSAGGRFEVADETHRGRRSPATVTHGRFGVP